MVHDYLGFYGGAEKVFFATKKMLEEKGHIVEVLGSEKLPKTHPIYRRFYSLKYYRKAKEIIKRFNPNVLYFFSVFRTLSPSVLKAAKESNVPVVMRTTDYHLVCPLTWGIDDDGNVCSGFSSKCLYGCKRFMKNPFGYHYGVGKFFKIGLHRAMLKKYVDYFIVLSSQLEESMKNSFDIPDNKISILRNFIEIDDKGINFDKMNPKQFLFVGRLSKEKGVDIAIKAVDYLIKNEDITDVTLKIVGDGPESDNLKLMVNNLGIAKNVEFVGWIENKDLLSFYQESVASIIPSLWLEAFGNVALEAMANGKPVIASKCGSFPDLVASGENGYLFERASYVDLAKYMKLLYNNREKSINLGKNGLEKVKNNFNKEKYYNSLIDIFKCFKDTI